MDGLEDNEPNTVEVNVDRNMSREEVVAKMLCQIRDMEKTA